jgi:hypothetical protein
MIKNQQKKPSFTEKGGSKAVLSDFKKYYVIKARFKRTHSCKKIGSQNKI